MANMISLRSMELIRCYYAGARSAGSALFSMPTARPKPSEAALAASFPAESSNAASTPGSPPPGACDQELRSQRRLAAPSAACHQRARLPAPVI